MILNQHLGKSCTLTDVSKLNDFNTYKGQALKILALTSDNLYLLENGYRAHRNEVTIL
jgi:hypothetical protein